MRVSEVVVHVVGLAVLSVLVMQVMFLVFAMILVVSGYGTPLLEMEKLNDVTVITANAILFLPVAFSIVLTIFYVIRRKALNIRKTSKYYLYSVIVLIVVILVLVAIAFIKLCGLDCSTLTCGVGNVESCTVEIRWLYAVSMCICKV
ncbi:MAG: hypothetical protein QXH10_08705 [Ignisphaera sp.]|uniref:Uncharacterized protein n=1 Tax=Ignisphaera aggregans TaxID=334771 RepID=A0A832FQ95_9CREN